MWDLCWKIRWKYCRQTWLAIRQWLWHRPRHEWDIERERERERLAGTEFCESTCGTLWMTYFIEEYRHGVSRDGSHKCVVSITWPFSWYTHWSGNNNRARVTSSSHTNSCSALNQKSLGWCDYFRLLTDEFVRSNKTRSMVTRLLCVNAAHCWTVSKIYSKKYESESYGRDVIKERSVGPGGRWKQPLQSVSCV